MSLAPGTRLGPYEIESPIGAGGMGEVYRARDTRLDRPVAVKVLPQDTAKDAGSRARIEREAKALAGLNHPHICTLYDVGEHEGATFLVMELLEGQTLRQRITGMPMQTGDILELGLQIADALAAAHKKGVIHRDIKPANVFVTGRGQVKVLDFGLAKASVEAMRAMESEAATTDVVAAQLTSPGVTLGTAAYMSPEQVRGQELDSRTDVFSLGAVLYEMATGRQAFPGATYGIVFDAILNRTPTAAARVNPDLAPKLEQIINRALEKDRELRCQSAAELCADLLRLKRDSQSEAETPAAPRSAPLSGALSRDRRPAAGRIHALVVLPLANLARDPEQDYFADGMTDALIAELAQIHALRVISRTSAMHYKGTAKPLPEIARELGVDGIVEGSVMRDGDRVRITARLIHAPSDHHVWARSYERDLRDVLRLQSEVARAIADEVQVTLTPRGRARLARARPTPTPRRAVDPEAYQLYLKGQYYWNRPTLEGVLKAIEYLQQAIDKDPSYPPAYSWLANCYVMLGVNYRPPHESFPKARAAASKALELDSTVGEPHLSMGAVQIFYDWDWALADHHLQRALALSPNNPYVHNLNAYYSELMGRPDVAMTEITLARDLDPLSLLFNIDVGLRHHLARRYARAIEQYQGVLEMNPGTKLASWGLWHAHELQGDYARALTQLRALTRAPGADTRNSPKGPLARESYMAALREELPRLQVLRDRHILSEVDVASVYTLLGEPDLAFEWLDTAYRERNSRLPWVTLDPSFDSLRADARFVDLLRRLNLHPRGRSGA